MAARSRSGPRSRPAYPLPTPWFALLVALSGLAFFAWPGRSWLALAAAEGALLVVFAVDAVLCTSPQRIDVSRQHPEVITLGDAAPLTWAVDNHHRTAARVTVTDALWPSFAASRRSFSATVKPTARLRTHATLRPTRRGRFPLRDVTVRVRGPMRLAQRQATRPVPGTLRVMPAYPSRDEVQRRLRSPRVIETGQRSIRSAGGGTDFDQLRDYRPDDEFRRIDWASTIRLQRPIAKQFRAERNQNVVVLLDNGRVMAGTVAGVPRVEHAMDAALAITQAAARLGDRVGMVTFDRQVRSILPASDAKQQLGKAAEAMYLLEPALVESAYTAAFSATTARFRRRSLYVVLTDLAEATVEEALLPAIPIITRTHLVVVAAVSDPRVGAWSVGAGMHTAPSEAFRQAAAVASITQRARATARLRAAGVTVVDAEPGLLGIRLVDTYLELKAQGRL
jgi:uncharacterized protein (DUF58 family)